MGAIIRGKAIIRGRRLIQIFLTEGRALNNLFYYAIKSKKNNHIKYKPNIGFLVFQICFVDYGNQCSMSISSASEPESSLITLTGSDSISDFRFTATEIPANRSTRGPVTM